MRGVGRRAEPLVPVGLVVLVVALEPDHPAVALEGQHVGGHPVEEPAVMGDHHRAPREGQQRVLEGAEGIHVEVVGGLVEQQQVAAALQQGGQVHAVALAPREIAHLLLLIGALEVERGHVGARGHLARAELEQLGAARDLLPHVLVRIEAVAALVHVGQAHRLPDLQRAAVGLLLAGDHAEERGLARAVGADDAHDAAAREAEGEVLDQQPVAVALDEVLDLHHHVAQPRARGDDDLGLALAIAPALREHLLVGLQARLGLGLARPRRHAHPLELTLEGALPRGLLLLLDGEALLLLLEPGGVVALPRNARAAVQLEDPARHVVEEVAVVGDRHHRARVLLEELLEPGHRLRVQVVGRLVQQQEIGLLEKQSAERHPPDLAAGQSADCCVTRRAAEGVHRDLDRPVQVPAVGRLDGVLYPSLLGQDLLHLVVVEGLP